jgi:ubiquinone/menaquinone biosynthesis C-methylase UbiE
MADPDRAHVISVYRRRARHYDFTANLYYLFGFREMAYRRQAVQALHPEPGATVVEIGCGTGLGFPLLQRAIGPSGRIIGVDLTDAMLAEAARRVRGHRWTNVELAHSDALTFDFPPGVDGIISMFALSLVPECGEVIDRGCAALAPGGRWVVLDLKLPDYLPRWLVPAIMPIVRPFAVTDELVARRPWDAIWRAMRRGLTRTTLAELYFGFAYIAAGERE